MIDKRTSRLTSLGREARWDIPPHDQIALSKFQDQNKLNTIGGLVDLIYYVMDKLNVDPLGKIVEVGCHYGVSTECFALFCDELTAVDPWETEWVYQHFIQRMSVYPHINVLRGLSLDAAKTCPNGAYDLVYLDACHHRADVEADIRAWKPKVKPGGFIAGHDYANYPGSFMDNVIQVIPAVLATLGTPDVIFSDSSWIKRL